MMSFNLPHAGGENTVSWNKRRKGKEEDKNVNKWIPADDVRCQPFDFDW